MKDLFPLVSIILPTYNRAEWLPRAINSILAQTYPNWELIIWNDGSQDDSEKIIDEYKDSRFYYFFDRNHGMSYALNNAINKAQGEYIAFLDDDDQWTKPKLSYQMDLLTNNPDIDMIFGNFLNINLVSGENGIGFKQNAYAMRQLESRKIDSQAFSIIGNFFRSFCISNFIAFDTVIIRRATVNKVGRFNESLRNGMDFEYWWRMALLDGKMAYTNEIMLKRIKPPGSLSSSSILTYENTIKTLDSCLQESLIRSRKELIPYLNIPYRNTWQNMISYYGKTGEFKQILKAFIQSMKYGFRLGSIRLLVVAILSYSITNEITKPQTYNVERPSSK